MHINKPILFVSARQCGGDGSCSCPIFEDKKLSLVNSKCGRDLFYCYSKEHVVK